MDDPLTDDELVGDLQRETRDVLGSLFRPGRKVALLDYPQHFNAGDTLIYRGERTYLDELTGGVGYVCTRHTYDRDTLRRAVPAGPLVLHGGGNFGDRYAAFQRFRERVVVDNPDRPIVSMPQTIEFSDAAVLRRTQRVYSGHPELTILLRSRTGFDRAREMFPDNHVAFCPDVAFGSGRLSPTAEPDHDFVVLKRRDRESVHDRRRLPARLTDRAYTCDWHAGVVDNLKWWPTTGVTRAVSAVRPLRRRATSTVAGLYDWQASIILRNAVAILSRGRVVVTDRLHAAVFAVLMGKPVVMVDNANRKLSAAHGDYLGRTDSVRLADDFDDATAVATAMLTR